MHLRIYGYVQGVSFRYSARQRAQSLELSGWVRNCRDGTVEMVVEGDGEAVRQFVDWAHRGPAGADVERVDCNDEPLEGGESSFRILAGS